MDPGANRWIAPLRLRLRCAFQRKTRFPAILLPVQSFKGTLQQFGIEQQAYELIIKTLQSGEVLGHMVVGMRDPVDRSYTDCWAFFCPHPWQSPIPLYTKIGIHHSRVRINLFSMHVDDGSEQLLKAIEAYRKKHKK